MNNWISCHWRVSHVRLLSFELKAPSVSPHFARQQFRTFATFLNRGSNPIVLPLRGSCRIFPCQLVHSRALHSPPSSIMAETTKWTAQKVRQTFLDYFKERGH